MGSAFDPKKYELGEYSSTQNEPREQLNIFFNYVRDNWKIILSEVVIAAVGAYLAHAKSRTDIPKH